MNWIAEAQNIPWEQYFLIPQMVSDITEPWAAYITFLWLLHCLALPLAFLSAILLTYHLSEFISQKLEHAMEITETIRRYFKSIALFFSLFLSFLLLSLPAISQAQENPNPSFSFVMEIKTEIKKEKVVFDPITSNPYLVIEGQKIPLERADLKKALKANRGSEEETVTVRQIFQRITRNNQSTIYGGYEIIYNDIPYLILDFQFQTD